MNAVEFGVFILFVILAASFAFSIVRLVVKKWIDPLFRR